MQYARCQAMNQAMTFSQVLISIIVHCAIILYSRCTSLHFLQDDMPQLRQKMKKEIAQQTLM